MIYLHHLPASCSHASASELTSDQRSVQESVSAVCVTPAGTGRLHEGCQRPRGCEGVTAAIACVQMELVSGKSKPPYNT